MDWDWIDDGRAGPAQGGERPAGSGARESEEGSVPERGAREGRRPDDRRPGTARLPDPATGRPRTRTIEAAQRAQLEESRRSAEQGGAEDPRDRRDAAKARRRQQLRRRRLIALGVVVAVLIILIVLVARACGGSSSADVAANPSPTPTALRTPSAKEPLRLAAYGDSVGGGLLLGLKMATDARKDVKVHRFVKVATGLARPDYFDWYAYLKQDMAKRKRPFDAVTIMLGANDGQSVKVGGKQLNYGSGSWKKWYAQQVGRTMDLFLKHGVKRVYWVGMPRMGIGWFNTRMGLLDTIYKAEAAKRAPKVEYVDAWKVVDAPKTTYQAVLRQADGVHLMVEGGVKVAKAVLAAVSRDWKLPPFKE